MTEAQQQVRATGQLAVAPSIDRCRSLVVRDIMNRPDTCDAVLSSRVKEASQSPDASQRPTRQQRGCAIDPPGAATSPDPFRPMNVNDIDVTATVVEPRRIHHEPSGVLEAMTRQGLVKQLHVRVAGIPVGIA